MWHSSPLSSAMKSSRAMRTQSSTKFFFFSSRRRHTRFSRDWISDVCSSDLGDYVVLEFPTLEFEHVGGRAVAVNDVVAASDHVGRLVELEWAIGGEPLGTVPCDAVILATPSGSTAYNLSNNGPVLMWGIDALTVSFVAPHSMHARPLVVPRGRDVVVTNRTENIPLALIADGHRVGEIEPDGGVTVRLGDARSLMATLPGATFLTRFRSAFA